MWIRVAAICLASAVTMSSAVAVHAKGYGDLDKLPDWAGVWQPDWGSLFPRGAEAKPKLTPATAKTLEEFNAKKKDGQNLQTEAANCIPPGMPGIMRMPYPLEITYSPGRVNILHETYSQVRRIYTDGRKLPDDPDPAFNGSSVGHWEGDTLVVDTIGLNTNISLMEGIHPTEATKIHETFRVTAPGVLTVQTTLIDPALFTEPYTQRQNYKLEKDWVIREYVCEENNRDKADEFGRPSMDISQ
jgi:hypothetical protein